MVYALCALGYKWRPKDVDEIYMRQLFNIIFKSFDIIKEIMGGLNIGK